MTMRSTPTRARCSALTMMRSITDPGTGNGNQNSGSYISQAEAKRIALAQVPGATENNVRKVKLDWDDGRAEYEVKIVVGMLEYEFEINAVNGRHPDPRMWIPSMTDPLQSTASFVRIKRGKNRPNWNQRRHT